MTFLHAKAATAFSAS